MASYSQFARPATVGVMIFSFLQAAVLVLALLMGTILAGFIKKLLLPEEPHSTVHTEKLLYLAAGVALLSFPILLFYLLVITRRISLRWALWGWTASAIYHGAFTWVDVLFFNKPWSINNIQLPPWYCFNGSALLLSVYLAYLSRPAPSPPYPRRRDQ